MIILFLTTLAYAYPVTNSEFLSWDDGLYLTQNPYIQTSQGWYYIWIENRMPNPYPLTFTVLWLEYLLFGLNSVLFHSVNLLFHLLNIVLFWFVLKKWNLGNTVQKIAVLVYALHPVQVQTVMWISELKNLLSATFYWISFLSFLHYFENKNNKLKKISYALGLVAFILSLCAKSMTVTLPVSLILWIWIFQRSFFWKYFRTFLLLWLISLFFGVMTLESETRYYLPLHKTILNRTLLDRVQDTSASLWFYVWKFFYPVNLIFIYPKYPLMQPNTLASCFGILILLSLIVFFFYRARVGSNSTRLIAFSFLNYGVIAFPILGFFSTSFMNFSNVSDHYQYHPLPFLILAITLLIQELWKKPFDPILQRILYGSFVAGLMSLTFQQAQVWTTSVRLWTYANEHHPKNSDILMNLGLVYFHQGENNRAEQYLQEAVLAGPEKGTAWHNLGFFYSNRKQVAKAIFCYEKALEATPPCYYAMVPLGEAHFFSHEIEEAKEFFFKAIQFDLQPELAHFYLAKIFRNDYAEATIHLNEVFRLAPWWVPAYFLAYEIEMEHQKTEQARLILTKVREIVSEHDLQQYLKEYQHRTLNSSKSHSEKK